MKDNEIIELLANCPSGITEATFEVYHDVKRGQLDRLVRAGKLRSRVATMFKPKGLKVTWYYPLD